VRLNGKPVDRLFLTHAELLEGGILEFEMASKPNKRRGLAPDTKPYSL
jgi:putative alpha-1,2-mannosidase